MGRLVSLETHALLRIDPGGVCADTAVPGWVLERLARTPWVVVRRARPRRGLVAVGVRGGTRAERFAGWLHPRHVRECLTPQQLAMRRAWRTHARRSQVAALAVLDEIESIMLRANLATLWGPGGSVGFELASGSVTATAASDVDLIVQLDAPLAVAAAAELLGQLAQLAARADVVLETPRGGLALGEYARQQAPLLLRTPDGPRLLDDPWVCAVTLS